MRLLRRLVPYLRRYRTEYFTGFALVLAATACGIAAPLLVRMAINRMEEYAALKAVLALSYAASGGVLAPALLPAYADHMEDPILARFFMMAAGALVLFAVVRGGLLFSGRYILLRASRRVEFDLRNDLFAHLETLSARYYDTHAAGDITSRAINDIEGVRMMIGIGALSLASTGLLCLASLAGMIALQPGLAALCAVPLLLVSAVMAWTGSRVHDLSLRVQEQLGVLSGRAQENFSGARVVRAFVREENEIARYREAGVEYRARNLSLARWRAFAWAAVFFFAEAAILVTLVAGGRLMIGGSFSRGDFAAFTAYQFMLVWPMIAIGWTINVAQRGVACMGRLAEILDLRPETGDARDLPGTRPLEGLIEARGLTFSYAPDRPPALRDVSFKIEPGQKAAIVGRTGAGKSTILQLLLRLYPLPDGMLFVDGRDINTIPRSEIRAALGCVPQDLFLFSDKIRENVAFGGLNGVDDAGVVRAAEIARLAPDVERFPDRYDQAVGERGITLSGGQKQRAALARALVREPRILVLDDALSSVDSHTEREIQEGLRPFMKGRTSIVITHRLSAIADADRILVLDDGRVAEEGRHEELLARNGLYTALWEGQRLEEELAQT